MQRGLLGGPAGLGLVRLLDLVLVAVRGVDDLLGVLGEVLVLDGLGGLGDLSGLGVGSLSRIQLGGDIRLIRLADGLVGVVQGDSDTVAASFLEGWRWYGSGSGRSLARCAGAGRR